MADRRQHERQPHGIPAAFADLPPPAGRAEVVCVEWPGLVAGSHRVRCSKCGRDCALSPETAKAIAGQAVDVVCLECFDPPLDFEIVPPTPGQVREMLE